MKIFLISLFAAQCTRESLDGVNFERNHFFCIREFSSVIYCRNFLVNRGYFLFVNFIFHLNKQDKCIQYWTNVGPPSQTLAQHWSDIGLPTCFLLGAPT